MVKEEERLDNKIAKLKLLTFAESTKKSYGTHLKRYTDFCRRMGYAAVPASPEVIDRYVAHLSEDLQFSSIAKYLNIIRLLHKEAGLPNPLLENFSLDCLLKGIKRDKGSNINRKLPILPEHLVSFKKHLNLSDIKDIMFWAACLLGFYAFLRKSNLFPPSSKSFDPNKHLSRSHLHFESGGIILDVMWAKNNQYRERIIQCFIPRTGGELCPVSAILRVLQKSWSAETTGPLFVLPDNNGTWKPLLYGAFLAKIKACIKQIGLDTSKYAGHSLRRGAATWALKKGIPGEVIQSLGDWHSQAYLAYLHVSLDIKRNYMNIFSTDL